MVDFDGELNLWADGVQILRGSLVGSSCNLGLDEQRTFSVGGHEGVGTYYAAVGCADETDTTGWFAALRMDEGSYAFFTAVEHSTLAERGHCRRFSIRSVPAAGRGAVAGLLGGRAQVALDTASLAVWCCPPVSTASA